ncbi:hypothetical protein AMATHDRAFT_55552 [Amanita thiersii Skay4041]|uniref:histidine kinase n=1 Tax=Amanita thiersii Skay4041 TaxID=703135 RepID=A0A2A9NXH6_9AGAR|nr:hypothetical protein AMATHDRAFT_55552 [Amanita thiersii Skay4041]
MQPSISTDLGSSVVSTYHPGLFLQLPLSSTHGLSDSRPPTASEPPRRKLTRPSTAPAREESTLLPSLPVAKDSIMNDRCAESVHNIPPLVDRKGIDSFLRSQPSNSSYHHDVRSGPLNLGPLPPPYEFMSEQSSPIFHTQEPPLNGYVEYDWATFMTAYGMGRWDPHRTPTPPRSTQTIVSNDRPAPFSDPPTSVPFASDSTTPQTLLEIPSDQSQYPLTTAPRYPPFTATPDQVDGFNSSAISTKFLNMPSNFAFPRMRNSFSTVTTTSALTNDAPGSLYSNTEVQTTVATMRWAAARVDISPLALPSPEHELTDPMRGITAAIPGSHLENGDIIQHDFPATPCSARKSRLGSFWEGTTDVDDGAIGAVHSTSQMRLATFSGSPSNGQGSNGLSTDHVDGANQAYADTVSHELLLRPIPETPHNRPDPNSLAGGFPTELSSSPQAFLPSDGTLSPDLTVQPVSPPLPPLSVTSSSTEIGEATSLPRRVCLTRQSSSPLPASTSHELRLPGGRVVSDGIATVKVGHAAKEEQMFSDLGYLAPPPPPDELERRRALYKFNIWHTAPDVNFDRIAHLVKLVFNTKGSLISLIDGHEQWFKSGWGTKVDNAPRIHSFCAHAILQRGDEPLVVLDTCSDWRFARNPLVTGQPYVRFYAGAPLRTHDGFNIGTLAIFDDAPWNDFSPRQRHTLKEFAAIVMREMELWRDKIQLRIRDKIQSSMEQFSRECLEIDMESQNQNKDGRASVMSGSSMDKVYDNAAKLVKRTLDVEGVIVMDISHCEVLESMSTEGTVSVTMHHGDPGMEMTRRQLSTEEYKRLTYFFNKYPDGKISEGIIPDSFRPFLPKHIQYALTVPIFNIDKRPFALICAYNVSDHGKQFLEGHELSYLRAIGVIILSAVLKRRMTLADKAKSLFISNISHELRTPLHGILAAAELLSDSPLNHSQASFLQTVQACGTSLVETVNHVLDFTKLSGNSKAGGVENVIVPTNVDLMQLVEEAVDGCWVGHRARTDIVGGSGIGSVYSPPKDSPGSPLATKKQHVETVVDVGHRSKGWLLKCEKGGIRRILMNLFGNSLKFTNEGFVHVQLRELPLATGDNPDKVKIELNVIDTGKGISQNFLKNQLFHPFSQENPLQTGTGLGLAIVSSILASDSVNGKIDVRSEEGAGTEIKVTFLANKPDASDGLAHEMVFKNDSYPLPTISLVGFEDTEHKGVQLMKNVLLTYLQTWWNFKIVTGPEYGDVIIINDDSTPVKQATEIRDTRHSFIIMSSARGNPTLMSIACEYERIGGFCRVLYKPGGPFRLWTTLKLAVHAIKIGSRTRQSPDVLTENGTTHSASMSVILDKAGTNPNTGLSRRKSEDYRHRPRNFQRRPSMTPRSATPLPIHSINSFNYVAPFTEPSRAHEEVNVINIGSGGTLLKASIATADRPLRRYRILVVEDNSILRNLLIKWLSKKDYDIREAVDGRDGVTVFKDEGPFDVVLLDLSMPILDGIAATAEIRELECKREQHSYFESHRTRILALTGMSSLEDKRRAFDAGVDGYLVKPVAFKTLDEMFHQLGIS